MSGPEGLPPTGEDSPCRESSVQALRRRREGHWTVLGIRGEEAWEWDGGEGEGGGEEDPDQWADSCRDHENEA